jgi:hypothetical protein
MEQYDPNTKYGWDKSTPFTLNGNEFGLILNTFRSVLATPEAQKIMLLNNANNAMEDVLKRNVESGAILPAPPEDSPEQLPMAVVPEDAPKEAPKKGRPSKKK